LRKYECTFVYKCLNTPLVQLEFLEPQLKEFMLGMCWIPGREGGHPEELWSRERDPLPWVVYAKGNEIL
jgi:hypothetical protein